MTKACALADCNVSSSGKCHLEHDPVETCPNFILAKEDFLEGGEDRGSPEDASLATPLDKRTIHISPSDALEQSDLNVLLRSQSPRIVALVGEQVAGKTTLIASLYAQFCRGMFGDFLFAGSKTLIGFAELHHLALMSSGLSDPKTPRTSRNDPVAYFHLSMRCADEGIRNLVISDRSGEAYEAARTDTSLVSEFPEFRQADRVAFLLDARKLASFEFRATYSRQFKQMIHALRDNAALSHSPAVEVLTTKIDVIEASENSEELKAFVTNFEQTVIEEFRPRGVEISCYRICALPKAKREVGFQGLAELLARWTAAPRPLQLSMPRIDVQAAREMDKLVGRWDLEAEQ